MDKIAMTIDNSNVLNLSKIVMASSDTSLLSKGFLFAPSRPFDPFQFQIDLEKFICSLQLCIYFHDKVNIYDKSRVTPKSQWVPPILEDPVLKVFRQLVLQDVQAFHGAKYCHFQNNLSTAERRSLMTLRNNHDIVIKRADKGGAVVVYPKVPQVLNNTDLHPFNLEENGGTPFATKAPGRHHYHHHHHHHHHSSYGAIGNEIKDTIPEVVDTHKLCSGGGPILYEDAAAHLKMVEVEAAKVSAPWPVLHININKGEEKKVSEKSLHPPLSPSSVPDHVKCNILKAQIDAAFRVGTQAIKEETPLVDLSKTPSLQETNVRSPAPIRADTAQSSGSSGKQEIKPPRLKKLTRQYSFDEDDLPPALAATVAMEAAATSQKAEMPQVSDREFQLSP
ncbi:band 4.1-like protein 4B [Microcaecilia unicolor]|uniref:Band 4.1-like protein 4B n=1 Tax=Microcaecilia unicolor TaxID=1415580 RepID=A0A6P7YJ97_9AMPH|nr:band 4.1-like protein 4B [Microcaecilia unicolor]